MGVSHEFLQAFESERPEVCADCKHLKAAASATYEQALSSGADIDSATTAGLAVIDPECAGMMEADSGAEADFSCIDNTCCGKPEQVCGRKEGPKFLLTQAAGIRLKLIEPRPL